MWTSIIDLSPRRVIVTNLLGRFWRGAYFSSFAPLQVQNVPRQSLPGANWVRVRNRLAGICGSDLHLVHADGDLRIAPAALPAHAQTYLGHEVVGEVIEIGDEVHQLQVGDRVVLQHGKNCLSSGVEPPCRSCAVGNYSLCERGVLPGPDPIGAGWSEEMLLHEQQLFRISSAMSDTQAVLLEPTAVAVHTVLRHVPQAGERVLIIGAGTIGLLTLQVVRALSPQAEISVLARYPFQVEKATRMGAAHIIYPQDSYSGVQQATQAQLYKGMLGNQMLLGGYDVIYDTIGTQKTVHNALRWARAKGTVVLVGLSLHLMQLDLTPVWYQEVNLIGTMGQGMETWPLGSHQQRSTFEVTSDLMTHGLLKPEQLITHHFALNNYQQALLTAMDKREQRAIKVVFDYSLLPASVVPNVRASARQHKPTTTSIQQPTEDVIKEEVPLQPVSAMLSTGGATWEKQALPVVPQPFATKKEETELADTPTFAPVPYSFTSQQDIDATQKVRIVEPEQEEPIEAMLVLEQPTATVDETAVSVLDETPVNTLRKETTKEEDTRVIPTFNNETTETVHAFNNEDTQAAPSIYNEATEAVPAIQQQHETIASAEPVDVAALDELEWLDIIAAEETLHEPAITASEQPADIQLSTPVEQEEQETQRTEIIATTQGQQEPYASAEIPVAILHDEEEEQPNITAPMVLTKDEPLIGEETASYTFIDTPFEEDATSAMEDLQYENEAQSDFRADNFGDINQDMPLEEYITGGADGFEKDNATNSSSEALSTTKTSNAINPGKQRSKNRHKGRNNSGSYHS